MSMNPRIEALEQQVASLSSAMATLALAVSELKQATELGRQSLKKIRKNGLRCGRHL